MDQVRTWQVLDPDAGAAAAGGTLADAVGALHAGRSAVVQVPDTAGVDLEALEELAARHGAATRRWSGDHAIDRDALRELRRRATARQQPVVVLVEHLDAVDAPDRNWLLAQGLRALPRDERLALVLGPHDAELRATALDAVDDVAGPALLIVATYDAAPVGLTGPPAGEEIDPGDVDEWVGALAPTQALRSAVARLDDAACVGHAALAEALEGLALAQALHRRDEAAAAALRLAGTLGAPDTDRALAAAQVRALQAVLRLDAVELRRAVADRHEALTRARDLSGPGDVPMIDGITGLAAVVGVIADAPARAPMGPIDATLLALADRLGPSAERQVPSAPGDEWSELRQACASAWSTLSGSELGIAWWHVALLACWLQARAAGWDDTGDLLRAALAFFRSQGFDDLAAEARAALRAQGERIPRSGRGSSTVPAVFARCGVTSREMDVLLLLREGMTDKEIAGALYLSPRTVGHHVASLLAKTALANRRELAAFAWEVATATDPDRMLR